MKGRITLVIILFQFFISASSLAEQPLLELQNVDYETDWDKEWQDFEAGDGDYSPFATQISPSFFLSDWWSRYIKEADSPEFCDLEPFSERSDTLRSNSDPIPLEAIDGVSPLAESTKTGSNPDVRALINAAEAEAKECRATATHVRRNTGKDVLCGIGISKGKCYAAVKDSFVRANVLDERIPGGSAVDAHRKGYMSAAGFVNRIKEVDVEKAPVGCVMVYSGGSHKHGHIEIKTGPNRFCSDFCKEGAFSSEAYKLEAIYCLP